MRNHQKQSNINTDIDQKRFNMKLVRKTLLTSFMIRLGGLAATIVVAGGLLLTPSFSWADTSR